MNNVIKSRTDHQVLSFPEEVKLFEEMFKAQDLHVMLAFQQRGDIRLHPRMAHYHRTSTQWRHMKPEQKKEHLRRFYLGLPPKTVPIRSRKYPNVELPADLSKVAKKIGQRKLPKKATTSNHRKKNKTANGVPLKTKRLGEKQTAAENLRDLKNKKKDNREPPKKRPTPKKPPKKQAPKKGPRAKNQQANTDGKDLWEPCKQGDEDAQQMTFEKDVSKHVDIAPIQMTKEEIFEIAKKIMDHSNIT